MQESQDDVSSQANFLKLVVGLTGRPTAEIERNIYESKHPKPNWAHTSRAQEPREVVFVAVWGLGGVP